jgi:hypothetical protein
MQFAGQIDNTSVWYTTAFIPFSDIPFNHFEQRMSFRHTQSKCLVVAGGIAVLQFFLEMPPFEQDLSKGDGELTWNMPNSDLGTIDVFHASFRLICDWNEASYHHAERVCVEAEPG